MKTDQRDMQRMSFWPRAGPAQQVVPDLGDDRPCSNCGYNLRGLSFNSPCPECGATWGMLPESEPISWNDDRPSVINYFRTVMMVLTAPNDLAQQIWTRDVLWRGRARGFRRINVLLGTFSLLSVILVLTARVNGPVCALWCAPVDLAAVLWWFIVLSGDPARFFKDKGTPTAARRAEVLSAYLSAPLVLSPLHGVLLALPMRYAQIDPMLLAGILHGLLIGVQMLLMAIAESAMLWQLVELPRTGTFMLALGDSLVRAGKGAFYIIVIPALLASMVNGLSTG